MFSKRFFNALFIYATIWTSTINGCSANLIDVLFPGSKEPYNVEQCRHVQGANGCEAIVIDHDRGVAYMACANLENRLKWWPPLDLRNPDVNGEQDPVFLYDLNTDELHRLPLQGLAGDFFTHGLGLWKPPTNDDGAAKEPNVLMFVNHGRNGSTVEIFEHIIDTSTGPVGKLVHVETVKHPLIQYPNDVHPVSSRSFYVTNDHLFSTKIMRKLEAYLSLPTGSLIFRDVDGQVYTAAKRIPYANGIAGYHNNTLLLVVSANTGNIHIYHRDDERVRSGAGYLKSPGEVNHGFSGDNLSVDPMTNKIYVTGTLEALRIFKLAHDPTVVVASKIARLDNLQLGSGGLFSSPSANTVTRLVTNDVEGSGSTVAAVDASRNRMLVGGLLQTGFRVCEIV